MLRLLAVEEVRNKFDDTRVTSGTADQDDLDRGGVKSTAEEILAKLFEMGTSEGSVEMKRESNLMDV